MRYGSPPASPRKPSGLCGHKLELLLSCQCSGSRRAFPHLFAQGAVDVAEVEHHTGRFLTVNRRLCTIMGWKEEKCETITRLHEQQPNISIAWLNEHSPFTSRVMAHFPDGMRKTGVK
jgi:PAS domain-containing protein